MRETFRSRSKTIGYMPLATPSRPPPPPIPRLNPMSELRFNVLTGGTSCHIPSRSLASYSDKPRGFSRPGLTGARVLQHQLPPCNLAPNAPFDLANAAMLPPFLQPPVLDAGGKPQIRVILNKFPVLSLPLSLLSRAVTAEVETGASTCTPSVQYAGDACEWGIRRHMPACGSQEVIIQHWRQNTCHALLEDDEVAALWRVLRQRVVANRALDHVRYVQVMENHGVRSGASLPHPHSQLLALPFVPGDQRARLGLAKAHWVRRGKRRNPFDEAIDEARSAGRVLVENDACAVFVPFAVERAYEMWVVSKTPGATDLSHEEEHAVASIAVACRDALALLYHEKDDPSYNLLVRSAPLADAAGNAAGDTAGDVEDVADVDDPEGYRQWYRWHVVIIPHQVDSHWAGIKGYGDFIPSEGTPEDHAAALRRWRGEKVELAPAVPALGSGRRRWFAWGVGLAFVASAWVLSRAKQR